MPEETQTKARRDIKLPTAEELLQAGVHFGHKTSKWNPKMKQYIFGARGGVHIIDLEKTLAKLKEAVDFVVETVEKGGDVLFVGTKPAVKKIVKEAAESVKMPHVCDHWLGGTLTNFKTISKRLEHYKDLERRINEGDMKKYTKKEQLGFKKELEDLISNFEGIKNLTKLPEAIFVADFSENDIAVREAKIAKVPVVAICDTASDPDKIDWMIPSNDDSTPAVKIIVDTIAGAIKKVKE